MDAELPAGLHIAAGTEARWRDVVESASVPLHVHSDWQRDYFLLVVPSDGNQEWVRVLRMSGMMADCKGC